MALIIAKEVTTPKKETNLKEPIATSECSGQIEMAYASALTSEEGIPIIKEQDMPTSKFSGHDKTRDCDQKRRCYDFEVLGPNRAGVCISTHVRIRDSYHKGTSYVDSQVLGSSRAGVCIDTHDKKRDYNQKRRRCYDFRVLRSRSVGIYTLDRRSNCESQVTKSIGTREYCDSYVSK